MNNELKVKLHSINIAYSKYVEEISTVDIEVAALKLKFSILINIIEDLYGSCLLKQAESVEILNKLNVGKVEANLKLPKNSLSKLIYSPESYASNIEYDVEDELDCEF